MTEFYVRGQGSVPANQIPNSAANANWTLGEGIIAVPNMPINGNPLRYMDKPSKDGYSRDAWELTLRDLDPHESSGPMNRAFYFMSQGASAISASESFTDNLPNGMTGVGNDHAGRIWYRAMSAYMSGGSDYVAARQAAISAAKDLFGGGSAEEKAVWNAFHGINVGPVWSASPCGRMDTSREFFALEQIRSCNEQYYLVMQIDGNLVLYKNNPAPAQPTPVWNSQTQNNPGAYAVMQADGNLVIYKNAKTAIWQSGTWSSPGAELAIGGDGNMIITSANGLPVWYVTAPASAATIVRALDANVSIDSAQVLDASKTGVTGSLMFLGMTSNFFRVTVPGSKTATFDFQGAWMLEWDSKWHWELNLFNASGTPLAFNPASPVDPACPTNYSCYSNTRIIQAYTNPGSSPKDVVIQVYRNESGGIAYYLWPYSMAVKYN